MRRRFLWSIGIIVLMVALMSFSGLGIPRLIDSRAGIQETNDVIAPPPPCEGDFDRSGVVDGSDLAVFAERLGQTNRSIDCEGDFCCDGDVDGSDLALFAADFSRGDRAGIKYQVHGLDFSPYMDGQDPNKNPEVSEYQLRCRMRIISPYTTWIRTFGCAQGLEKSGRIAHELGLRAAVGAWLGRDPQANDLEIQNLISAAKNGHVDTAIVGSEVLLRGDLTEAQLLGYIERFKSEVPGVPVTTADVYNVLLEHPHVMDACDVLFVNYFPYWEGQDIDHAVACLHARHQEVVARAGGKEVIVSETGWPSDGNQIGDAVPSLENACFYFLNFVSWARANNVRYFYFEALDEAWKAAYEGPQGAHWGVWDKCGILKPCTQDVFDGRTIPDNWTCREIPGGPGDPAIEFTSVPPYGSFENLKGQVWHVEPGDYRVAVYIYVVGGWWTKPYWNNPVTVINCDGRWECDITTGGVDERATRIAAYLIPSGYDPPLAGGSSSLPPELEENSLAKAETTRTP